MKLKSLYEQNRAESQDGKAFPVGLWQEGIVLGNLGVDGLPRLILELKSQVVEHKEQVERVTKGLIVKRAPIYMDDEERNAIIVAPKQSTFEGVFFSLGDHLLEELSRPNASEGIDSVLAIIDSWASFFKNSRPVSRKESILGMLGELLTIRDHLDPASFEVNMWTGPDGGLHDFSSSTKSIEVKVSGSRTGPLIHKVSHLDQLTPPSEGDLYLVSFRAVLDKKGGDSILALAEDVRQMDQFAEPWAKDFLNSAISDAGINEEMDENHRNYRVIEQKIYKIEGGFPTLGLEPSDVDSRVVDIVYSLDFSGLGDFETKPTLDRIML